VNSIVRPSFKEIVAEYSTCGSREQCTRSTEKQRKRKLGNATHPAFFSGSRALFTGLASTFFQKNNFKTGSHGTIHTFKNYFVKVFSVFSF